MQNLETHIEMQDVHYVTSQDNIQFQTALTDNKEPDTLKQNLVIKQH